MPINPNIALGAQAQPQPINMLGQMGQIYALRAAKQEFEGGEALRDFYASGGDTATAEGRRALLAANPKLGSQILNQQSEMLARDVKTQADSLKTIKENVGAVNTPEAMAEYLKGAYTTPGGAALAKLIPLDRAISAIPIDPKAFADYKRNFGLTADKLFESADAQLGAKTRIQAANIGAAAPLMNARLNREKFDLEQTQQSDVAKILQSGAPTNALAPTGAAAASVNALATPPSDIYSEISNIDARIRQLVSSGNPKAIAAAQVLNSQRTQLLASAKQEFGGNQIPVETTGPDGRPITVMMRPNRYGVNVPVETAPLPLSTDASATGGTGISPTVARPAPTAAVIKERQATERLPEAIAMNNDAIRKIDEMIGGVDAKGNPLPGAKGKPHPGFTGAVGFGLGAQYIPGTDARGFKARHEEVLGQAFLDAFEALKGGGAITQIEGEKATSARTRMALATSEKEYMDAAREYQGVLKRGIENARSRIQRSGGTPPPSSGTPSSIDALLDKYK